MKASAFGRYESALSQLLLIFAFAGFVSMLRLLADGLQPNDFAYLSAIPNVSIRITSVMLFTGLFMGVLYPLYRSKAIWILGLAWGLIEGTFNIERAIFYPSILFANASGAWPLYMLAVAALFSVSFFALCKRFKPNVLGFTLLGLAIAWNLLNPFMSVNTTQPLYKVLEFETTGDLICVGSVLCLFPWRWKQPWK
jgi:hypothetical protein